MTDYDVTQISVGGQRTGIIGLKKEIARYGVMGNPALVIDGRVAAVGCVPSKSQLKDWLRTTSKK